LAEILGNRDPRGLDLDSKLRLAQLLRSKGVRASVITGLLGISGRQIPKGGEGMVGAGNPRHEVDPQIRDYDFVKRLETMRKDPKVPIIAREIDDYAWWRYILYNLGADCFLRVSPLAGLTIEDRQDPMRGYEKLSKVLVEMLDVAEKAQVIAKENEALKAELENMRRELERYKKELEFRDKVILPEFIEGVRQLREALASARVRRK